MRYGILVVVVGPALALGGVAVSATMYGTREGPSQPAALRSLGADYAPAVLSALIRGAGLGRLVARLGDAGEAVDPKHPPAFLRVAARGRRGRRSFASVLADQGIGADRTWTRRESPGPARAR
jgi:hypothetical protein